MFQITPYPEWSWSHSRDHLFQECPRRYFYHYYGSHNGWLRDATEEQRTTYRLKQMANLYLIFGDALHQLADMYIRQWQAKGHLFSFTELYDKLRNLMNQAVLESKNVPQWAEAPKKRKMLVEMYYYQQLPKKIVESIKERMDTCLQNLLDSESLREITTDPRVEILEMEKLNTIYVRGEKVYVKLDILYRIGERYIIADWKTGQEDDSIEEQLYLYAYYLTRELGVPLEQIEIRTEYLLPGTCKKTTVTAANIEQIEEKIVASTTEMKSYLQNPVQNQPLSILDFQGAAHPRSCRFCNYRQLCELKDRELTDATDVELDENAG
ncbi:PD-(D/E)XK nuclease family protein [Tumebacillus permanentifrigoris]|uniref:PD-(D/E)XK nuclease superfamily protein n=1 Tax=Tumebacillus permanentifrigoris TaxID=378543 RepID=A0A316D9H7_9BACL|nr:PD-(D/E)XK nuclease family protein [Tumebacillus permanentifrigoris]PWK08388.1 PD-(D/E)XK nuclease superfamily protein [Tumebacillus permanentifrigoris]